MFKENFERLCYKRGIAPSAAYREMGLNPSTLSKFKNGSMPRRSTLLRMAEYFNCSVEDLTGIQQPAQNAEQPDPTTFWEIFLKLCNEKRTSPAAVGRAIGITSASISGWKKGAAPREATLARLADYFGVEPADLFPIETEKENAPDAPQSIGDAAAPQSDEDVMRDYLMNLFDRADQSGKDYLISVAESVVLRRPGSLGRKK